MDWLEDYAGQTTDEFLALEREYSTKSLCMVLEQALDQKIERAVGEKEWGRLSFKVYKAEIEDVTEGRPLRGPLTEEELIVMAIVALQREVRNGGHDQMFSNRVEVTPMLVKALRRIGREDVAAVTQEVLDILNVQGPLTDDDAIFRALDALTEEQRQKIFELDTRFDKLVYPPAEDLLSVSLWNFIKANRDKIRVP